MKAALDTTRQCFSEMKGRASARFGRPDLKRKAGYVMSFPMPARASVNRWRLFANNQRDKNSQCKAHDDALYSLPEINKNRSSTQSVTGRSSEDNYSYSICLREQTVSRRVASRVWVLWRPPVAMSPAVRCRPNKSSGFRSFGAELVSAVAAIVGRLIEG